MPSERGEEVWVDEMDGPERLARAKKRRSEQLDRWERRENTTACDGKRSRKEEKILKFKPNIVILEAAARNDLKEGLCVLFFSSFPCHSVTIRSPESVLKREKVLFRD